MHGATGANLQMDYQNTNNQDTPVSVLSGGRMSLFLTRRRKYSAMNLLMEDAGMVAIQQ